MVVLSWAGWFFHLRWNLNQECSLGVCSKFQREFLPAESVEKIFYPKCVVFNDNKRKEEGGGAWNRKKERIFIYGMECCTYHVLSLCFLVSKTACCFCIFATPLLELLHLGAVLFPEKDFIFRDLLYLGFWFNDSLYHKTKAMHVLSVLG